jgi:hypothetical protein
MEKDTGGGGEMILDRFTILEWFIIGILIGLIAIILL